MRILLADDHPVVLQGMCSYLASKRHAVVGMCRNGIEAWNSIVTLKPEVAMLDQNMPGMSGLEIAQKAYQEKLNVKIVLLTMHKEKSLLDQAISVGVKGYLLKDFALDEADQCLHNLSKGKDYYSNQLTRHMTSGSSIDGDTDLGKLSPAERKILMAIAEGKNTHDIAEMFFIAPKTVEKHRSNIIKKLSLPQGPHSIAIWAARNIKQE